MERKRNRVIDPSDEEEEEEEEEDMDKRSSPRKIKRIKYIEDDEDDEDDDDDEDEEEEEEEEEEEDQEDNEQPGTSAENTHNQRAQENRLLAVTCGNKKGELHVDKFERGEACIESEDRWFYPCDFEDFGGKASSKKWKKTISHKNKSLQFWMEQGCLTTKGFKRRGSETIKQKKILLRNPISVSSSEESEIQSAEEIEEDDVKDDDWFPGSEELSQETEADEIEKAAAENEGVIAVDSGDDKSQEGEMEDDDMPAVAENSEDNGVFEERETKLITPTPEKRASSQMEVKVVIQRLPEATRDCQSNGIKHLLEENQEERESSGSAIDDPVDPSQTSDPAFVGGVKEENGEEVTRSNERKEEGEREIQTATPLCAPATSAPGVRSEILNKTKDIGSTSNHRADLSTSHDAAQLQVMNCEARVPQVSDSTQPPDVAEDPISTCSNLETMDLDQLKREKIKMQLKVLKLQDEYYTLKIKELKK